MKKIIYLDHNSSTATDMKVISAMEPFFATIYANPSSGYTISRNARNAIEDARACVSHLLGASADEIVFTAGGTEANNFAIKGVAFANKSRGNHIITSKIEHKAVLNPCKWLETQGFKVTYLDVDKYGVVDLNKLKESIISETILITIMHANNEVGTIEPIEEISNIAHSHNVYFHTDAVQTVGKIHLDVKKMNIDLLSLSSHKFYGPKGIGSLYIRKGTVINPLIHGGSHERNLRAGTENVPGIIGLGKACEVAEKEMVSDEERVKQLRDKLYYGIKERIPEVIFTGHPEQRLAGTLSLCVKGVEGESMLLELDASGICAISGSACTSGSFAPSHVLSAMGIPPEISHSSLRFSLGRPNTEEEIDYVLEVFPGMVTRLREISPFWKNIK